MNQTTADLKPVDAVALTWVDRTPERLRPYLRLMRLDRPIGTWLLFWPCVFGLILGAIASERPFAGWHDLYMLVLFGIGAVVMRGAGCTYNDIVDRDIDASVARTRGRPIPSGAVTLRDSWLFLIAQCVVGLAILAFATQTEMIDWADAMLYAGLFFWTLGYDTIYALQDKEDDALIGVKSTALLFGARARDWILAFYAVAFALILAAGFTEHAGWPFALLMFAAGAHLLWQVHVLKIDDPERCLKLFRANRDTGALIACAFLFSSWIW